MTLMERLRAWWAKPVSPDDPDADLDPQRRDEIIEWTARQAQRFGVITPAYIFADMNRPLMFVYSQFAHFFSPFADTLFGGNRAQEVGYLLENPKNLDRFLARLEEMAHEQDSAEQAEREARRARRRRGPGPA